MRRNDERLTNDVLALNRLFRKNPIGFEHQIDSFDEIRPRFFEADALRIGARQLLNEGNITLGHFAINGSQLHRKPDGEWTRVGSIAGTGRETPNG